MASDLAKKFSVIFAGLGRSSGRYVVGDDAKPDKDGKVLGRAWTSSEPITVELWDKHLSGEKTTVKNEHTGEPITGALGLGVVPIRDDDTVVFGAIDVDVYPLDLAVLQGRAKELDLPIVICRTKSGGAHVYLFLSEPTPAVLVRERLSEWAVALNHPGVEIFPKQAKITEHSLGSWINVPYSGGNRSVRYALADDGTALSVEEFVEEVSRKAVSWAALNGFELPEEEGDELFPEGPPCLQTLARVGFGDWQNNGLFNVAVYLKMVGSDSWREKLAEYNERLMDPSLSPREVAAIAKSVGKKAYFYKCKDQPIASVCNRAVCLKREHGVGSSVSDPGVIFGELTKVSTEPILWLWSVDGMEIELATVDLTDQRRFRNLVIEKLSKWPNMMKPEDWTKLIRSKLETSKNVAAPEDGTREGQTWGHLATFCTGRARAKTIDEILLGKPFTDKAAGRVYFQSKDFFSYLSTHRFAVTEREVWRFLRKKEATNESRTLKGKSVKLWSVPAFPEQTEEHDVPRGTPKPEM